MNKSKKAILIAVTAIVFGVGCYAAYYYHKAREGCECLMRLHEYNKFIPCCGVAVGENVPENWKSPKATEAMMLRVYKMPIPVCPAGGVVRLVEGIDASGVPMPIAVCSLAGSDSGPHGHFDPGNGRLVTNMRQHIPRVSRADVERIVARDFPSHQVSQVLKALSAYGRRTHHREVDRVHLDILKLAAGDMNRITRETENACGDYHDTMASAEYPNFGKKRFRIDIPFGKMTSGELDRVIEADRDQYEAWLDRETNQGEQTGAADGDKSAH